MRQKLLAGCVAALLFLAGSVAAQEKPKAAEQELPKATKPLTPLKVQVVFIEYEGEKKISSLPYTLFVNADDRGGYVTSSLRMGIRVPIFVQAKEVQVQYQNVGTDIDCKAESVEEGRYRLSLSLRRSSVYAPGADRKPVDWAPGDQPLSSQPIMRDFGMNLNLLLRDGQTMQTTMATDPISGRVLKVDVTLNVVK